MHICCFSLKFVIYRRQHQLNNTMKYNRFYATGILIWILLFLTFPLLPRFSGTDSLNPAKVELMYYPVVHSNNNMRKIQVIDNTTE